MQLPAWGVHILGCSRVVQGKKLATQSLRVLRLDAGLGAGAEEALDTFVPEALDHTYSV